MNNDAYLRAVLFNILVSYATHNSGGAKSGEVLNQVNTVMKILRGQDTGMQDVFFHEKGTHYYREDVYFLEEDAYFLSEDARFSGEGMSLHREKLRLQIGDAHFNVEVTVSYYQREDLFPHRNQEKLHVCKEKG